jgi:PAS domain S-box-containing protein
MPQKDKLRHILALELFDSAPDAVLVTNLDGLILQANRKAYSFYRYDAGELIGMSLEKLMAPELIPMFQSLREAFLIAPVHNAGLPWIALLKDGTLVNVVVSYNFVTLTFGMVVSFAVREEEAITKESGRIVSG